MKRMIARYWKVTDSIVKLQIKTTQDQRLIEEVLSGWQCVSYGYAPKTKEDIYVFEKRFESDFDLTKFLNSSKINSLIEMKEVPND